MHEIADVDCPRCGGTLEGDFGEVQANVHNDADAENMKLRTHIDCPECGAPLTVVIESALPDTLGFEIWAEDRIDDRSREHDTVPMTTDTQTENGRETNWRCTECDEVGHFPSVKSTHENVHGHETEWYTPRHHHIDE